MRAIAIALLAAAALVLWPAAAHAAGPGVTLFINTDPTPVDIPGEQFAGGRTLRALVEQQGVDPAGVAFVTITRADGGVVTLRSADLGGALIIDDGTTTRFARGGGADKVVATNDTGPLQINVNGGDISVMAKANRTSVKAGESITFSATVRFAPPGAQLSYEWDFGDGAVSNGSTTTHVFKFGGPFQVRVTVRGSGGASRRCASSCTGTDDVDVTVGEAPPPPPPPPTTGNGTGTGTGGGGTGGTGGTGGGGTGSGGTGTGTDPTTTEPAPAVKPKPKPKPPPPPKKPFGVTISGVLIDDVGATVKKLPGGTAAGAAEGPRRTPDSDVATGVAIPVAAVGALALFMLGALRERRGVKLRLA